MLDGLPAVLNKAPLRFVAQPIFRQKGELYGHEMLLLHKQHKDPAMFMKIVNHMGLRQNLDLEVCRMAEPVLRTHRLTGCCCINLFADSLQEEEVIEALLMLSDPSANRWVMVNVMQLDASNKQSSLSETIADLRQCGVRFCFDVKLLMQITAMSLPVDMLRMDIRHVPEDQWARWISFAESNCVPMLAAGVDDEAHREILSQLGIDFLQGKIFADMVLLNQNT
jgi:EAL domain-containing protein (putative c-di-GMP-specific phosphodiesterase class I)